MTLILKLDLDMVKMYLHTKNEVSMSSGSKVIAWTDRNRQTHRQTDMTENITYLHTRVVTRMHSSRMRTVCSLTMGGVPAHGGTCPPGICTCPRGYLPRGVPAGGGTGPGKPPLVDRILDTRYWKYYLAPTLLRVVPRKPFHRRYADPGAHSLSFVTLGDPDLQVTLTHSASFNRIKTCQRQTNIFIILNLISKLSCPNYVITHNFQWRFWVDLYPFYSSEYHELSVSYWAAP